MAKIIFLGTASSIPTDKRDNTSFILTHKKFTLLIDCPGSIPQKLLKIGLDFRKIRDIVITHEHPDHIYGIISLIHTQAYFNDILRIFTTPPSIKIIRQLIKLFDLNKPHYPKIKYVNVFKRKNFLNKEGLRISAIRNKHIPGSFGIRASFSKKSLFYSSDTSFSKRMLKEAGQINYLIHDCTASSSFFQKHPSLYEMHTSARELSDYLKAFPKIKFIPVHFLLLTKSEEKKIRKELKSLDSRVIWAEDFKTITL